MKKALIIPAVILGLVIVAFATTNIYKVPTIDLKFVAERPDNVEVAQLTVQGVKCRGTSMMCAQQLEDVPGVVGMTTYTRTHTAIVEYDPTVTDVETIREAICRPIEQGGQLYEIFSITE